MLYILCDVCDNSQTTEYMKQVNTSLILIFDSYKRYCK